MPQSSSGHYSSLLNITRQLRQNHESSRIIRLDTFWLSRPGPAKPRTVSVKTCVFQSGVDGCAWPWALAEKVLLIMPRLIAW